MEQLGLAEGYKSLMLDEVHSIGHRLLAEAYSNLPRYEVARLSELLQSQLRQSPVIPPPDLILGQDQLFIDPSIGIREFSARASSDVFTANQNRIAIEGFVGSKGTYGGDFAVAGLAGKFSYSLGHFALNSNGLRSREDLSTDVSAALIQYAISLNTHAQAEFRLSDVKRGEIVGAFDPDSTFVQQISDKRELYRVGLTHQFSVNSDLVVSLVHEKVDFLQRIDDFDLTVTHDDARASSLETQYSLRAGRLSLILGMGGFQARIDSQPSGIFTKRDHRNVYFYSTTDVVKQKLKLHLGVAYDNAKLFDRRKSQVSPKFGLSWLASSSTTVRLALYRSLQRELVSNRTIEPTQVAGFNQFYDGADSTTWWHAGLGVDHVLTPTMFLGAEIVKRKPIVSSGNEDVIIRETSGRAYAAYVSSPYAVSAEYFYDEIKQPLESAIRGLVVLRTHRLPLSVAVEAGSGLLIKGKLVLVSQMGLLSAGPGAAEVRPNVRKGLVDVGMVYRLPGRRGTVEFSVKNLFDNHLDVQEVDPSNPVVSPNRFLFGGMRLEF